MFRKDIPDKDRLSKLEMVVTRLARRIHKTVVGIIPSLPLSACISGEEVKGEILRVLVFKGNISKGVIIFNNKPRNVLLEVSILSDQGAETRTINLDRQKTLFDLDIDTSDGSMIKVSIWSTDEKYRITEVWLGVLWNPHMSNNKIEQRLIEELDKVANNNVSEE